MRGNRSRLAQGLFSGVASLLFLGMSMCACERAEKQRPSFEMERRHVLSLHVDTVGRTATSDFVVPADAPIYCVFVTDGVPVRESDSLVTNMWPIVLHLEIREGDQASTLVYETDLDIEKFGYPGNWHGADASFVVLLEPFTLGAGRLYGIECTCDEKDSVCPVHTGRLVLNHGYRLSLRVEQAASVTNELNLWFYYPAEKVKETKSPL